MNTHRDIACPISTASSSGFRLCPDPKCYNTHRIYCGRTWWKIMFYLFTGGRTGVRNCSHVCKGGMQVIGQWFPIWKLNLNSRIGLMAFIYISCRQNRNIMFCLKFYQISRNVRFHPLLLCGSNRSCFVGLVEFRWLENRIENMIEIWHFCFTSVY